MFTYNIQNESPISYCGCCHGEIYSGDTVYDLSEIYTSARYIVHEDCMIDSLTENKELVMQYLFSDLCLLQDVFNELLTKYNALDVFDDWEGDNYCE
ncbi:MAG: hypothetical protein BWY15_00842 [Firmicutes bacterium ADurb.Bin193]|nr:MAG: hypothetical protein BWY15_00842 [Firmicutes bacterium ADurb.Bin193]